jgi:hypothetical protein
MLLLLDDGKTNNINLKNYMIMNKKIFTLLIGVMLAFSGVLPSSAQGPTWTAPGAGLAIGLPETELSRDVKSFYHLKVDSIRFGYYNASKKWTISKAYGTKASEYVLNDSIVLLLGENHDNSSPKEPWHLFLAPLGRARDLIGFSGFEKNAKTNKPGSKAAESAAALWCTSAEFGWADATYTFTNKLYGELLNLDLEGIEKTANNNGWVREDGLLSKDSVRLNGYYYQWAFSENFLGGSLQQRRPLYLPLGDDSVAVLCLDTVLSATIGDDGWNLITGKEYTDSYRLTVRKASAEDVRLGNVDGILYFTLHRAQPFVLSADDFNDALGIKVNGKKPALQFGETTFDGNPFLSTTVEAEHINPRGAGFYIRPHVDENDAVTEITGATVPGTGNLVDTIRYKWSHLDSLGYLFLKDPKKTTGSQYVRVDYEYWTSWSDQYLKIKNDARDPNPRLGNKEDSLAYGQYAFRFVYDPTADNIRINAFQAAYGPEAAKYSWLAETWKATDNVWTDSLVQARLTYVADSTAFEQPVKSGVKYWWSDVQDENNDKIDSLAYLYTNLKDGLDPFKKNQGTIPDEFNYFQRLYLTGQSFGGGNPIVTLGSAPLTRIYFPGYHVCGTTVEPSEKRTSIASDLYLIRNAKNEYLNVPLYTADDVPVWSALDPGVDPAYIPSFHWVIKKTVPLSSSLASTSPLTITNREFAHVVYNRVQLEKDQSYIRNLDPAAPWNSAEYGITATADDNWSGVSPAKPYTSTFVHLTDVKARTDATIGYRSFTVEEVQYSNYQLEVSQDLISGTRYLVKSDTLVKATGTSLSSALTFKIDTLVKDKDGKGNFVSSLEPYGYYAGNYADKVKTDPDLGIAILTRRPYNLKLASTNGVACIGGGALSNFAFNQNDEYYAVPAGANRAIISELGLPAYYLRDVQTAVEGEEAPSFALVQILEDIAKQGATDRVALTSYLQRKLPTTAIGDILGQLKWNGDNLYNPGLFIAAVESNTGNLKAFFRANPGAIPATFRLRTPGTSASLYRRLNTIAEDTTNKDGKDIPVSVRIHRANADYYTLFGNEGQYPNRTFAAKPNLNLLDELDLRTYGAPSDSASATLRIDPAYIGDGVKPQYLISTSTQDVPDTTVCDEYGNDTYVLPAYTIGRYLINLVDTAKVGTAQENNNYLWSDKRVRLAFVDAVHANDSLYFLGDNNVKLPKVEDGRVIGFEKDSIDVALVEKYIYRKNASGQLFLDIRKLNELGVKGSPLKNNNKHKPYVFSFRLPDPDAKDFLIESLPYGYKTDDKAIIDVAPCQGSWIVIHNQVPVVSAQNALLSELLSSGAVFEISRSYPSSGAATSTAPVASSGVKIVSGVGSVSIQGAAGRRVTVTNVLGQSVISKVLSSDAETLTLPRGIVLVTVAGTPSVKAAVK